MDATIALLAAITSLLTALAALLTALGAVLWSARQQGAIDAARHDIERCLERHGLLPTGAAHPPHAPTEDIES